MRIWLLFHELVLGLPGENVTLETVMAFLKSRPPDILKPQGDGPARFIVKAMMRPQHAVHHLMELCSQNMREKKLQLNVHIKTLEMGCVCVCFH